jgi:hypothetical protein
MNENHRSSDFEGFIFISYRNKKAHYFESVHLFFLIIIASFLRVSMIYCSISLSPPTPHILRITFNFMWKKSAAHFQFSPLLGWNGRREDEISKLYDCAEEEEGKDELLGFWLKGL